MAKKLTKRLAFNFLRSYFDVLNELQNDEDRLAFLMSIINKQFLNEDPKDFNFIVDLCYESQRHSVEKSVKGWMTANKTDLLGNPTLPPTPPPKGDPTPDPTPPPKEEEVEEKGEVKEKDIILDSVSSPPIGVDPLHFYIAKGFHKVFIEHNPNAKHLKEATVNDWVRTSRLIIEKDKTSIDRLLAIKWYFELGIKKTKGIDTFYLGTISSISAFRGKNKIGEYKIDNIFKIVFKWLEKDSSRHSEVFKRKDNLLELVAKCQN